MSKTMSDRVLMKHPTLDQIERHLNEAGRLLDGLRKASGRNLSFFGEDSLIYLIDGDADDEAQEARRPRGQMVDKGGCIVRAFRDAGYHWSGGGF